VDDVTGEKKKIGSLNYHDDQSSPPGKGKCPYGERALNKKIVTKI
jgi:hypothetical protein